MKRLVPLILMALLVMTGTAAAQSRVELALGGGATVPTGDFGNAAKAGWHALATVAIFPGTSVLGVQATGFYGQNTFKAGGGKWKLSGGVAELRLEMRSKAAFKPFFMLGGGLVDYKAALTSGPSASNTKAALDGGVGVAYNVGANGGLFLQGRYVIVFSPGSHLTFVPFTAGFQVSF